MSTKTAQIAGHRGETGKGYNDWRWSVLKKRF